MRGFLFCFCLRPSCNDSADVFVASFYQVFSGTPLTMGDIVGMVVLSVDMNEKMLDKVHEME
jgi:hypothetical protein